MTTDFLEIEARREIAKTLAVSFHEYYRYEPSEGEVRSWHHSLHAMAAQIKRSSLLDNGIILEMQLPLTSKRIDCLLMGRGRDDRPRTVLIELKQWTDAMQADEEHCVQVYYGAGLRTELHPSYQVRNYADYLREYRTVFYEEGAVELTACSWLHNFQLDPESALLDEDKFGDLLKAAPLFAGSDAERFTVYLDQRVGRGLGREVLDRVSNSRFAPSKKLMEHTAAMIKGEERYTLLDEQRVAYEKIMLAARKATRRRGERTVIVVQGGPGTGKSVIALNAMADLMSEGKNVQHATGSKAFTENIRRAVGPRAAQQFRYFNSFVDAEEGEIDVLICDEAHRIRESSNNRFTASSKRSTEPQVDELISSAKVSVFFLDDDQVVRPSEVGSTAAIESAALALKAKVVKEKLTAQFRCSGSDEYIRWINAMLAISNSEPFFYDTSDGFDFRIFNSPEAVEKEILLKASSGESARMTAGFCWPWSKPQNEALINDVVVGDYQRPWNARSDAGRLPTGIPKESYWATDPAGIDQVGCIYTAQGFEFDHAGVIFGPDLVMRNGAWQGKKMASCDMPVKRAKDDHFLALVKNTYRVLLTRGLKGCYVYFVDDETRAFFDRLTS